MDYKPPELKPLTRSYALKNLAVVDIETNRWLDYEELKDIPYEDLERDWHGKRIKPFLVGFYNHVTKEKKTFEGKNCMRDFLQFYLTKKHRNTVTFAHYGGKFDFTSMHETLVTCEEFQQFIPKIVYVNGGIMILRVVDKHKNAWQFRDSSYLLKDGLAKLCKNFKPKTRKLKMPPYPFYKHKPQWRKYCLNDCISLAMILEIFSDVLVNKIGGSIGLTASSTALRTWRKKFQKYPLPTYYYWNKFIRKGYYGGRCEVFTMYAPGKAYLYDVKSMYPSVMVKNEFPMSSPRKMFYQDAWDCTERCGFMECDVITPEDLDIPVLPYRNPTNDKLLFPLGNWTATYEFTQIKKALQMGYKITPHRAIEFEGDYLFTDYVRTIYPYKEDKQGALAGVAKLLMNGLYGKYAERPEREIIITEPEADIEGTFPISGDPMGYTTKKIIKYGAHHLPAISAKVTALAQIKLYEAFEYIHNRRGTIYYTDTDSVITNVKIPSGVKLGDWELKEEITRGIFFAPKAYCYEYYDQEEQKYKLIQKIKGFSKDFTKTLHFEDFRRALPPENDFSALKEPSIHPSSFKEISTRHLPGFSMIVKKRNIKTPYDKRALEGEYSTKPLTIGS